MARAECLITEGDCVRWPKAENNKDCYECPELRKFVASTGEVVPTPEEITAFRELVLECGKNRTEPLVAIRDALFVMKTTAEPAGRDISITPEALEVVKALQPGEILVVRLGSESMFPCEKDIEAVRDVFVEALRTMKDDVQEGAVIVVTHAGVGNISKLKPTDGQP